MSFAKKSKTIIIIIGKIITKRFQIYPSALPVLEMNTSNYEQKAVPAILLALI